MSSPLLDRVVAQALEFGRPVVVDSSALIAYLGDDEPTASAVATVIDHSDLDVLIPVLVLSEALVRIADRTGREGVEIAVKSIERIASVSFLPFDLPQAIEASVIRAKTRLKLPDASIVAAARISNAIAIIGNDRVWKSKPLGIQYIHLDDVIREYEEEIR